MKAFLSRRPSTAPSLRDLRSDATHTLSSHQQKDDGDFYYPASSASSVTHGRSRSHAERGLLSVGEASGSGSGSGSRAGYDIGTAPSSRAPPSSWARNKGRFSLSRSDSAGSRRSVKVIRSEKDSTSGTTGARSGGSRLSHPTPGVVRPNGASYDEINTETIKRREVPLKHNRAFFEKTTHPTVFVVTKTQGDSQAKHDAAPTSPDLSNVQSFNDESRATSTVNSSHVTLLEALEQCADTAPHCSVASPKVSGAIATLPSTPDKEGSQANPKRTATVDDTRYCDTSIATRTTFGSMLRGIRRKASLPLLSAKALGDEPVAKPMRQAPTSKHFASPSLNHRPVTSPTDLAAELRDLAVSHGNGLLNDEEYRVLRKGLFELAQNGEEVAVASSSAATSFWQGARSALDAGPSRSWPIAGATAPRGILDERSDYDHTAMILASTSPRERRISSRRGSIGLNDGQQTDLASSPSNLNRERAHLKQSSSSIRSANSTAPSIAPDRRSLHTEASHAPSHFGSLLRGERTPRSGSASIASSQVSSKRRFRGPSKEEEEERMRELERIVQETRSVKSLKFTTRKDGPHSSSAGEEEQAPSGVSSNLPVDSASFLAMAVGLDEQDMEYGEKSSELIQAEIRILQAEGDRVTKAFDALESGVLEKGRNLLRGDVSTDGDGKGEAERKMHWLQTGEWPETADKPAIPVKRRKKPPSTPPSAFRRLDGPLVTPPPIKAARALSSTAQLLPDEGVREPTNSEVSSQLKALRKELETVESGKRDVIRRYDDRIAFLKSKERAAKIREAFA